MLKVQMGQLSAAAWANKVERDNGSTFERLSVKIEKRYKDADGAWKSSNSYTLAELLRLQHFVGKVMWYCFAVDETTASVDEVHRLWRRRHRGAWHRAFKLTGCMASTRVNTPTHDDASLIESIQSDRAVHPDMGQESLFE